MFICADTEDDSKELLLAGKSGFDKKVTQIAALSSGGKDFYSKGNVSQFLDWLRFQPERHIYFHNLQYDLGNLFSDNLDSLDITMVGGRLIKAIWGNKIFVDSFNLWPMSAKKIGEAFGKRKLETGDMAHDKAYIFRDAEIIYDAVKFAWDFCNGLGIVTCPATLGGLAVKVWRAWGGENVHDSGALSRRALYGGRVELFKVRSEGDYCHYTDVNSLYPYVMGGKFPGRLSFQSDLKAHGVATVTMSVPKLDIAVLPLRDDDGRILYPYGKFTGTWTIPEIRAAVDSGAKIEKLHETMGTDESIIPYRDFTERLYRLRGLSTNDAGRLFFKLLMNNLYGRMGVSGEIGRSVWQTGKNKYDGLPYGKKVLVKYKLPLAKETNWSHAAYVTSYGRLELLKYLRQIGSDRLIYCDTDSAIFEAGKIPFSTGSGLGQMKIVRDDSGGELWPGCETFAPKTYRCGKKYLAKGVPKDKAKKFILTGLAHFDMPFKMREAIRFYDRENVRKLSVWREVEKRRVTGYDRKKLIDNRYFSCKVNRV